MAVRNKLVRSSDRRVRSGRRGNRRGTRPHLETLEGRTLLASGLVAAYNFDAGSGSVLADVSGHGNNGTITNATWSTAGKYGDALQFTGAKGSWVTISDSKSLDLTNGMTLEAWVDPSSLSSPDQGWSAAIAKQHVNSINDISYALYAAEGTGTPPAGHILVGSTDYGTSGGSKLALNRWTFLTATYDGSTLRTYVNGNLVGSTNISGSIFTTTDALRIGGDWSGEMFTGLIDNVRIYNTALSQSQIQIDMNTPVPNLGPTVIGETPASNAIGVTTNTTVTATFNEAVQANTINFTLTGPGGAPVPATLSYNSTTDTATVTPSSPLAEGTTYTATVSGVKDSSGNPMASPFSWSFTTISPPPTVTSESPASGAAGVSTSTTVTATFSEAVQASTISFVLTGPGRATVPATVSYNGTTHVATLTPSSSLAGTTTYTATVSGAKTADGVAMSGPVSWSFTTAAQPAPSVVAETPAPGATNVATNTSVTVTFDEAVLASTVNTTNFVLQGPGGAIVPATVSYNSTTETATLSPSAALANATTYTATISGVENSSGIAMTSPFTWSFTTDSPVAGAPTVIGESPAPGASGVAIGVAVSAPLTVTFNEPVQASTINFTLTDSSGNTVASTIWYSDATATATLTPESATLTPATTYTATVSGAQSLSGVAMSSPFTWSFTTAAKAGATPAVISTSPSYNGTSVDISTPIAVNFNEAVLASSITSSNFVLQDSSGNVIPATISYSDTGSLHTATLTPNSPLAYATTYTATISGVQDSAGNTMLSSYSWSFTTDSGSSTVSQLPLVYPSNLQYLGGFRVPNGNFGPDGFSYAGQGLAYDPSSNTLFMSGYVIDSCVAQISIPSTIVNSTNIDNLSTATVLQPFVQVLNQIPNTSNLQGKGQLCLGGLMVVNGQLLGTEFVYYDTSGTTVVTHFRYDSLNLSKGPVEGMFQVGNLGAGLYDGYMAPIPSAWQSTLGAPYLTGNAALSIITRTSFGPAVFGFDPSKLSTSSTDPAIPYVYYTQSNPAGPMTEYNRLFDGNTSIAAVFFVPGTRTVLFVGSVGTNQVGYGEASTFHDPYRTGKGYHSLDGDYADYVWAYDANDLAEVASGQVQPWQIQPYATWTLDFPQFNGSKYLGGVAFDPSTNRLYVTELGADTEAAYSYLPVIQVFQLTLNSTLAPHSSQVVNPLASAASPRGTGATPTVSDAPSGVGLGPSGAATTGSSSEGLGTLAETVLPWTTPPVVQPPRIQVAAPAARGGNSGGSSLSRSRPTALATNPVSVGAQVVRAITHPRDSSGLEKDGL